MQKTVSLFILVLAILIGGCTKTEAEKFDDEFEEKQAEIDAKAKEIEEQGAQNSAQGPEG